MMAGVRGVFTMEMEDLETYRPGDSENFRVDVRVVVGAKGKKGADCFDLHVFTPKWLSERCEKEGFVNGRHSFIVNYYDAKFIKQLITRFIEKCDGPSWQELAQKVGRLGRWEFEDFTPKP